MRSCRPQAQPLVPTAKGTDSLFGRWMSYVDGGDGGDIGLKAAAKMVPRCYRVTVLEVVDENTPDAAIEQIESWGKNKLLSRGFGLNRN